MTFYWFDPDPMTLILKLDLNRGKVYLYTKDEIPSYNGSKVTVWTDRQTWLKLLPTHMYGW